MFLKQYRPEMDDFARKRNVSKELKNTSKISFTGSLAKTS